MNPRRSAVAILVAVFMLAACGSSGDTDTNATSANLDGDVVAVGAAPPPAPPSDGGGGISGAIEVMAQAPGEADIAACDIDQQTLQTAIETYEILNGALPTSQQDLLDAQMIRELSVRFEITPDGGLVPGPGSPCT